jgi:hypothetical protein
MSLLDYQEAVPWANAIKLALLERRMPPFLPDGDGGPFRDARELSALELDTLVDWAVGSTPEGEPAESEDAGAPESPPSPDLVLRPPEDIVLEESASEKSVCLVLPTALESPQRVGAVEVLPGTPSLLRRATILVGGSCSDGEPLATWLPDRGRVSFPPGFARELPASSSLALELLYEKGWGQEGKRLTDRTALGLWFSKHAAAALTVLIAGRGLPVKSPVRLIALYPSMGDEAPLRVEAVAPDGSTRLLLAIERFDAAWREKYFFREPIPLPAGSALRSSHAGVWADLVSAK